MGRARSVLLWLGLVVAQAAFAEAVPAPRVEASEAAVKAAFLYKFATYVEWPPSAFPAPESELVFGVAGSDAVAAELEKIVPGHVIHNHPTAVRRLKEGEPIAGVHLLFVGRTQPNARAVVRAAQQQGILCVTETESGLDMGSTINFVAAGEHVGFEVSLDAAERSGLRISSRMLNVARRVVSRP